VYFFSLALLFFLTMMFSTPRRTHCFQNEDYKTDSSKHAHPHPQIHLLRIRERRSRSHKRRSVPAATHIPRASRRGSWLLRATERSMGTVAHDVHRLGLVGAGWGKVSSADRGVLGGCAGLHWGNVALNAKR
jgi:hypothetical protein